MSDSDSDDDPNLALLREATDTDFMTDAMFKSTGQNEKKDINSNGESTGRTSSNHTIMFK